MNSLLADLLNAMLASGVMTACVWFLLRFAGRDSWNAHSREAVWWLALLATVMTPLLPLASSSVHHLRSLFTAMPVRVQSDAERSDVARSDAARSDAARFVEVPSSAGVQWTSVAAGVKIPKVPV